MVYGRYIELLNGVYTPCQQQGDRNQDVNHDDDDDDLLRIGLTNKYVGYNNNWQALISNGVLDIELRKRGLGGFRCWEVTIRNGIAGKKKWPFCDASMVVCRMYNQQYVYIMHNIYIYTYIIHTLALGG